jgi:hypothetical protein
MQFSSLLKLNKYKMPIPLQTLITLPLYNRLYMYSKLRVSGNEKNVKPPLENKNKFRRTDRGTVI